MIHEGSEMVRSNVIAIQPFLYSSLVLGGGGSAAPEFEKELQFNDTSNFYFSIFLRGTYFVHATCRVYYAVQYYLRFWLHAVVFIKYNLILSSFG